MTNRLSIKNILFMKWTVFLPPEDNTEVSSESFMFFGCKCTLKIINKNRHSRLYFFNHQLAAPIKVLVTCIPGYYQVDHSLTNKFDIIWEHPLGLGLPFNTLVTFEIIIYADPPDDIDMQQRKRVNLTKPTDAIITDQQSPMNTGDNIHLKSLSEDFLKLLDENSSCDVKIMCKKKLFNAHRVILETRSSVFAAMLNSNMIEDKTKSITIHDVGPSIFQSFLQYLYSGTLPLELSISKAKELYRVGDKYDVQELKNACSEFLIRKLCPANAYESLVLADQHSDSNFRQAVISYIVNEKLPRWQQQWPDFCKNYPALSMEVKNLYIQKY